MGRLGLDTDPMSAVWLLTKHGCFRAIQVCGEIMMNCRRIDPEDPRGMLTFLHLDACEVWDGDIRKLYNACGQNLSMLVAVVRAHQYHLAGVTSAVLRHAIEYDGEVPESSELSVMKYDGKGINFPEVIRAISESFPNFRFWECGEALHFGEQP